MPGAPFCHTHWTRLFTSTWSWASVIPLAEGEAAAPARPPPAHPASAATASIPTRTIPVAVRRPPVHTRTMPPSAPRHSRDRRIRRSQPRRAGTSPRGGGYHSPFVGSGVPGTFGVCARPATATAAHRGCGAGLLDVGDHERGVLVPYAHPRGGVP